MMSLKFLVWPDLSTMATTTSLEWTLPVRDRTTGSSRWPRENIVCSSSAAAAALAAL